MIAPNGGCWLGLLLRWLVRPRLLLFRPIQVPVLMHYWGVSMFGVWVHTDGYSYVFEFFECGIRVGCRQ